MPSDAASYEKSFHTSSGEYAVKDVLGSNSPEAFEAYQRLVVAGFGSEAAVIIRAFERRSAEREMAWMEKLAQSEIDPLTGLARREVFEERVKKLIVPDAKRESDKDIVHGLIIIDLDDLKKLNNNLTHLGVDARVLKPMGQAILSSIRDNDIAGRWGGDEFVVHVDDADEDEVRLVAERIHSSIHDIKLPNEAGRDSVQSTLVYMTFGQGADYDKVFQEIDSALLQTKQSPVKGQIIRFQTTETENTV